MIDADVSDGATYSNFNSTCIIHLPTDIIQITARIQVFNQSDVPIAANLLNQIKITPYIISGQPEARPAVEVTSYTLCNH